MGFLKLRMEGPYRIVFPMPSDAGALQPVCDIASVGDMKLSLHSPGMSLTLPRLPPKTFPKLDPSNDDLFYAEPRFVVHIDDLAIDALMRFYALVLLSDGAVLDLMSSWVSHLPPSFIGEAVGHGMNAAELAANPRLSRYCVQNLNVRPELELEGASFDAAVCCVGVQYLGRPDEVFREIGRVLRPGAPFIISFSNRCFPTKAVAVWRALDSKGHAELVGLYLRRAGFRRIEGYVLCDGSVSDPLTAVVGYC
jgi:SAM-dependent methyltransferase